jgi:hypothetical protein
MPPSPQYRLPPWKSTPCGLHTFIFFILHYQSNGVSPISRSTRRTRVGLDGSSCGRSSVTTTTTTTPRPPVQPKSPRSPSRAPDLSPNYSALQTASQGSAVSDKDKKEGTGVSLFIPRTVPLANTPSSRTQSKAHRRGGQGGREEEALEGEEGISARRQHRLVHLMILDNGGRRQHHPRRAEAVVGSYGPSWSLAFRGWPSRTESSELISAW